MNRTDLKIGLLMLLVAILYGYARLELLHESKLAPPPIQQGLSTPGQPLGAQPTQ